MRQGFILLSLSLLALIGIGAVTGVYAGWIHLQAAVVASGLMLVAGLAVFVVVKFTNQADPGIVLVSYAASVSIRGLFGLGGGLLAEYGFGWFEEPAIELWLWLLAAYLIALIIETVVLVSVESKTANISVVSAHGVKG